MGHIEKTRPAPQRLCLTPQPRPEPLRIDAIPPQLLQKTAILTHAPCAFDVPAVISDVTLPRSVPSVAGAAVTLDFVGFWMSSVDVAASFRLLKTHYLSIGVRSLKYKKTFVFFFFFNPALAGVSAERHWLRGGGEKRTPSLSSEPIIAVRRARRQSKALNEFTLDRTRNCINKVICQVTVRSKVKWQLF